MVNWWLRLVGRAVAGVAFVGAWNGLGEPAFRNANAFETQFQSKVKEVGQSRDEISFNGQASSSSLKIKVEGKVLDFNASRVNVETSDGIKLIEPAQTEKVAVSDTRATVSVWDNWVRWTSRQAVSNYTTRGTDQTYLTQIGMLNSFAMSQRMDVGIWKNDWMRVSLFADYARVGNYFRAPDLVIKRQDPFSKPNSTTTKFGATVERGPFTFTFDQRAQQSLAQDSAPVLVQNQIGLTVNFDELRGNSGGTPVGLSWVTPSSAWVNVGQGKMRASLSQGVAGDTTSDVSAGLSWSRGQIQASLGYWQSEYRSQFYPWQGSGSTLR